MSVAHVEVTPIVKSFLVYLKQEKKYSANTLEAYEADINVFMNFMREHLAQEISKTTLENLKINDFRNWIAFLGEKRIASSKARATSVMRSFYRFCEKRDILKNENIFLLRSLKVPKRLPRALNVEEAQNSISEIENIEFEKSNSEIWVSLRDKALLALIYSSGLRVSEALNLKPKDIESDYLRVIGKGNKERIVPLLPIIKKAIEEYISECRMIESANNPEGYLFIGKRGNKLDAAVFQKTIRKMRQNLELPESVTPHAFRHSFATHLLSNSGDLRTIQELLGHASLSTTQIYTKIEPSKMLEAYAKIKN